MPASQAINTVSDIIKLNAEIRPEQIATIYGDVEYSFVVQYERALKLANTLSQLGCEPQDRIAILAKNCIEYLDVYHACAIAGYIIVPVNFRLTIQEITYICKNTRPRVYFYSSDFNNTVASLISQNMDIESSIELDKSNGTYQESISSSINKAPTYQPKRSDPVCIIHTSGTTGYPKGAVLSQSALAGIAQTISDDAKILPDDYALVMQPFFHVGALFLQLAHHVSGAKIQIEAGFDPEKVWQLISSKDITTMQLVPTMLDMLLSEIKDNQYPSTKLRTIFYSTAPINENLLRRGLDVFGQVFIQQYGSTEAGQVTSLAKHFHIADGDEAEQKWLRSAGKANPEIKLRIVDNNGKELPAGEPGEITVSHPNIMQGYWEDPDSTAETLKDNYLHMGDIGYLDSDGFLYIIDRKKDMIISGGENIYPREIEGILNKHPAVTEAAVIGIPDERWGEAVLAFIVRKARIDVTEEDIISYCKEQIASYKKPKQVEFLEELPRIATGKIDKVSLCKPYWANKKRHIV